MLKTDGDAYLTYSTCSLNPIENEAVVYAALKKLNEDSGHPGEFELIDWREKLLPFKTRKGLLRWSVYDSLPRHRRRRFKKEKEKQKEEQKEAEGEQQEIENQDEGQELDDNNKEEEKQEDNLSFEEYFREYKVPEDIPEERQIRFKSTFFPPEGTEEEIEEKYHLSRWIRVFANDQNTSGFFIALFRRNSVYASESKPQEETKQEKCESSVVPVQHPLKNLIRCDPSDPDIEFISTYYGLSDDFPFNQIFTYSDSMNKLMIINKGLSDLFYADTNKQLNLIAAGAETFIRNTSKKYAGTECIYRISQNGVHHVYPFMTKRIYRVENEVFLGNRNLINLYGYKQ
jgi:hypothetical protein